jgi:hypothetical protein
MAADTFLVKLRLAVAGVTARARSVAILVTGCCHDGGARPHIGTSRSLNDFQQGRREFHDHWVSLVGSGGARYCQVLWRGT